MRWIAVTIVGTLAFAPCALAAGNPDRGRVLVETSCTACHAKAGSATSSDVAPSFSAIAQTNAVDRKWVRSWLTGPHPPMQGIDLSRQQIDDVIAYLQTIPVQ